MWQLKSDKITFLFLVLLMSIAASSQEAIKHVQIEKLSPTQFRINYLLKRDTSFHFTMVIGKIFRKRNGRMEEIFSEDITPYDFKNSGFLFSYRWITEPGTVIQGDELQAKILLTYNSTSAIRLVKPSKNNIPPHANAGNFMDVQLPVSNPVVLNGSKSFDSDGRIIEYSWKQIAGPTTVTITPSEFSKAVLSGVLKEGNYAFELTVRDQHGATSKDRIIVTVKSPEALVAPTMPAVANLHKDSTTVRPAYADPKMGKLKGGPSNALLDLLLPGVGHYFASGNPHGHGRKPVVLGITALYAGAVGGSFYFLNRYNNQYNQYTALAAYREYQKDINGNIIGVRGGNEEAANQYLQAARASQKNARMLLGAGAGILAADFIYTMIKGLKNKARWKHEREARTTLFFSSDSSPMTAGIKIKF